MDIMSGTVHDFWTEDKCHDLNFFWPVSRKDYWNLSIGVEHEVELLFPYRIDFPLSKRSVVILDKVKVSLYDKMMSDLNQDYSEVHGNPKAISEPSTLQNGLLVVAWHSEIKSFVRARIRSKKENVVRLYAFDNGENIETTEEDIYPICNIYLTLPPRVVIMYLDGLQRFDRLNRLKVLMKNQVDWSTMWTMHVTRTTLENFYCTLKRVDGINGSDDNNLNHFLLKELWTHSPEPRLPPVNDVRLRGYIVNIRVDGTVAIQFDSPYASEFIDYVASTKNVLDQLVLDEEAFSSKRAPLPLNPDEVYLVPYGDNCIFYRAKYIPDRKTPPGKVCVKFIDYGNEDVEETDGILLAKEIDDIFAILPAQCIEAKLVNIFSLNLDGAYGLIDDSTPVIVRTITSGDASQSQLPQVQILISKLEDRATLCFSSVLVSKGLAIVTPELAPNTYSNVQAEFTRLE